MIKTAMTRQFFNRGVDRCFKEKTFKILTSIDACHLEAYFEVDKGAT